MSDIIRRKGRNFEIILLEAIESFLREILLSFLLDISKALLELPRDNPWSIFEYAFLFVSKNLLLREKEERKERGREKIEKNDEVGTKACPYFEPTPTHVYFSTIYSQCPVFTRPSNRTFCLIKSCDR